MTYRIAEQFTSINGEAAYAGAPAVFIRFPGCNLNCSYCDTAWVNEAHVPVTERTKEELLAYIKEQGVRCVTLTGGEPLLQEGIAELIDFLSADGELRIEIETNGSVSIAPYEGRRENVCFTLDYKLAGSGMEAAMDCGNYSCLKPQDAIKFVVSDRSEIPRVKEIVDTYQLTKRAQVFLSPVFGSIDPKVMVEDMLAYKMRDVRLQLQLHKIIWDPMQRGV